MKKYPEVSRLQQLLSFDVETGNFIWLHRDVSEFSSEHSCRSWNTRYAGKPAGTITPRGYVTVRMDGHAYLAHRLVWCLIYGAYPVFPDWEIDHINGNPQDNSAGNLRLVTRAVNAMNRKLDKRNKTGISGVGWDKYERKWRVSVSNGKILGRFESLDEAIAARRSAEASLGYHPNHGRVAA